MTKNPPLPAKAAAAARPAMFSTDLPPLKEGPPQRHADIPDDTWDPSPKHHCRAEGTHYDYEPPAPRRRGWGL